VHDDAVLAWEIYIKTPSHCFGNHQSNLCSWSTMHLLLGLCSKIAHATGADQTPGVRDTLGNMAAVERVIAGMVHGQIHAYERWPEGYVCCNRRMMSAALEWCTQKSTRFIDQLCELSGGSVFQLPADSAVLADPHLAEPFLTYFQTPQADAVSRMKLFTLAWDMVGSAFAGRHLQAEKFCAGAPCIVRGHAYRETPWEEFHQIVDDLLASSSAPAAPQARAGGAPSKGPGDDCQKRPLRSRFRQQRRPGVRHAPCENVYHVHQDQK
jgi:4-hydroxyphenylacetate 3-monooxygenase